LRTGFKEKEAEQMNIKNCYTKTDYEKDRDFIRQYDGVKFEFPRTDRTGKKVNILYRIPHLNGLYIETGAYGDVFGVCYDEPEYNLSNVKKEVDEYEKHRTILKQVQSAMDRVKEYESVNGEPEDTTGSGTAAPGEGVPDINDENYTPPLRAAQIYSTLRIDRGTLQKNKPLGMLFTKHCNNGTARLPWLDFWATAKSVVERSKSDLERDLLTDINTFKELFLMP
jgi:hypothetical protein